MVGAAGRAAAPGNAARVFLQLVDEIADGLQRRGCRNDDRFIFAGQACDRGHFLQRHGRIVGEDRANHDVTADDEGMRVALLLAGELRKTDGAAGARYVLHLNALGNAFFLQHALQRARGLVPAATGIGRCDDGVICRSRRKRDHARQKCADKKMFHVENPPQDALFGRRFSFMRKGFRAHLCRR